MSRDDDGTHHTLTAADRSPSSSKSAGVVLLLLHCCTLTATEVSIPRPLFWALEPSPSHRAPTHSKFRWKLLLPSARV